MTGFGYAVSTKANGNMGEAWGSDAVANRAAFYTKHELHPEDVVLLQTEHKDVVVRVGKNERGSSVTAEALITNERDTALALLTADCFPVSFYDPAQGAIGLAHCGWRPVGHKLVQSVVRRMGEEFGTVPAMLKVRIGPGIHPNSYVQATTTQLDDAAWAPYLLRLSDGQIQIDLLTYIVDQLREVGVEEGNVVIDPIDTAATPTQFSHYRAIRTNEPEGRFMTVVWTT